MLHTLTQEQLAYLRFPLGSLTKPEVRTLARGFGLPVADKAESQEICFVGKGAYADFVAARRPDVTAGRDRDGAGEVARRAPRAGAPHRRPAPRHRHRRRGAALRRRAWTRSPTASSSASRDEMAASARLDADAVTLTERRLARRRRSPARPSSATAARPTRDRDARPDGSGDVRVDFTASRRSPSPRPGRRLLPRRRGAGRRDDPKRRAVSR